MIELRWITPESTHYCASTLQWRAHLPVVDIGGHLCPGDWTEWQSVPTVALPIAEFEAACKPAPVVQS